MKLSDKQQKFCREYVVDFNATAAAIRAGYAKRSARQQATRMMSKDHIQREVASLTKDSMNKVDLTVERVLEELKTIAFLDPAQLFDEDGNLLPIHEMPEGARRCINGLEVQAVHSANGKNYNLHKIKLVSKEGTLEKLAKYLQMYMETVRHEHTGQINMLQLDDIRGNDGSD